MRQPTSSLMVALVVALKETRQYWRWLTVVLVRRAMPHARLPQSPSRWHRSRARTRLSRCIRSNTATQSRTVRPIGPLHTRTCPPRCTCRVHRILQDRQHRSRLHHSPPHTCIHHRGTDHDPSTPTGSLARLTLRAGMSALLTHRDICNGSRYEHVAGTSTRRSS